MAEVKIYNFVTVLLTVLTKDERDFYKRYIDYLTLEEDPYAPVLKFYFNDNDYIHDGLTKGQTIDITLRKVNAFKMVTKSLFEKMHGFRVLTAEVPYHKRNAQVLMSEEKIVI